MTVLGEKQDFFAAGVFWGYPPFIYCNAFPLGLFSSGSCEEIDIGSSLLMRL
jgi:hypothetical protein